MCCLVAPVPLTALHQEQRVEMFNKYLTLLNSSAENALGAGLLDEFPSARSASELLLYKLLIV